MKRSLAFVGTALCTLAIAPVVALAETTYTCVDANGPVNCGTASGGLLGPVIQFGTFGVLIFAFVAGGGALLMQQISKSLKFDWFDMSSLGSKAKEQTEKGKENIKKFQPIKNMQTRREQAQAKFNREPGVAVMAGLQAIPNIRDIPKNIGSKVMTGVKNIGDAAQKNRATIDASIEKQKARSKDNKDFARLVTEKETESNPTLMDAFNRAGVSRDGMNVTDYAQAAGAKAAANKKALIDERATARLSGPLSADDERRRQQEIDNQERIIQAANTHKNNIQASEASADAIYDIADKIKGGLASLSPDSAHPDADIEAKFKEIQKTRTDEAKAEQKKKDDDAADRKRKVVQGINKYFGPVTTEEDDSNSGSQQASKIGSSVGTAETRASLKASGKFNLREEVANFSQRANAFFGNGAPLQFLGHMHGKNFDISDDLKEDIRRGPKDGESKEAWQARIQQRLNEGATNGQSNGGFIGRKIFQRYISNNSGDLQKALNLFDDDNRLTQQAAPKTASMLRFRHAALNSDGGINRTITSSGDDGISDWWTIEDSGTMQFDDKEYAEFIEKVKKRNDAENADRARDGKAPVSLTDELEKIGVDAGNKTIRLRDQQGLVMDIDLDNGNAKVAETFYSGLGGSFISGANIGSGTFKCMTSQMSLNGMVYASLANDDTQYNDLGAIFKALGIEKDQDIENLLTEYQYVMDENGNQVLRPDGTKISWNKANSKQREVGTKVIMQRIMDHPLMLGNDENKKQINQSQEGEVTLKEDSQLSNQWLAAAQDISKRSKQGAFFERGKAGRSWADAKTPAPDKPKTTEDTTTSETEEEEKKKTQDTETGRQTGKNTGILPQGGGGGLDAEAMERFITNLDKTLKKLGPSISMEVQNGLQAGLKDLNTTLQQMTATLPKGMSNVASQLGDNLTTMIPKMQEVFRAALKAENATALAPLADLAFTADQANQGKAGSEMIMGVIDHDATSTNKMLPEVAAGLSTSSVEALFGQLQDADRTKAAAAFATLTPQQLGEPAILQGLINSGAIGDVLSAKGADALPLVAYLASDRVTAMLDQGQVQNVVTGLNGLTGLPPDQLVTTLSSSGNAAINTKVIGIAASGGRGAETLTAINSNASAGQAIEALAASSADTMLDQIFNNTPKLEEVGGPEADTLLSMAGGDTSKVAGRVQQRFGASRDKWSNAFTKGKEAEAADPPQKNGWRPIIDHLIPEDKRTMSDDAKLDYLSSISPNSPSIT